MSNNFDDDDSVNSDEARVPKNNEVHIDYAYVNDIVVIT